MRLLSPIGLLVLFSTLILMAGLIISVVLRLNKRNLSFRVFLSLLSVTAKSAFRPRRKIGSEDDKVGRGPLQFVMVVLVLVVAFWLAGILTRVCMQMGQPELLFMLATTTLCLLLVFSGGYLLLSVFLWSIDNERLIALPITSGQIVLARLTIAAAGQYPISLLFLIPTLLKYLAYMGGGGPAIWLTTFLVALLLPIFTLTLVAIPIVLTMRFVTDKLRERLLAGGSLLLSLGSLLFYMQRGISTNQANLENMMMQQLQLRQADLMTLVGRIFPPALWAGRAIAYAGSWRGTLNLVLLATAAAASIYALYQLSVRSFVGSVATGSRVRQSRSKRDTRAWSLSTPLLSLFHREWKLFWRTPALVVATLPNALLPMIGLYPLLRASGTEQSLWTMAQLMQGESGSSLVPALVAGALALMLGINSKIALVSFSKDGPRFYFSKMIPVDYRTQVKAKLVLNLALNGVCLLPLFLFGAIWLHLRFTTLLAALLLSIVALCFTCITCMGHDLAEPRLDWDNLQMILKRGVGFEPFVSTGFILVLTTVFCYLMISKGWSITLCYLVVLAIYSLLAWVGYQSLLERADRQYEAIEM